MLASDSVHGDFETKSTVDLKKAGAFVYAGHPSTDAMMLAYAFNDEPIQIWRCGEDMPVRLRQHIESGGRFVGHNVGFEHAIWNAIMVVRYGWPKLAIEQCDCTAAMAAAMSLPRDLDGATKALGLPFQKDAVGHRIMLQCCKPRRLVVAQEDGPCISCPHRDTGRRNPVCPYCNGTGRVRKGQTMAEWWDLDPVHGKEKFEREVQYCISDTSAERGLESRLVALRPREREVWLLDHKINSRGVAADMPLITAAERVVEIAAARLDQQMAEATGYEVQAASQVQRLAKWLDKEGVSTDSLDKEHLVDLLERDDLPAHVERALRIRQEAAKASTAKLNAMKAAVSRDGRIRGMFLYWGAGPGRWAGTKVMLHNLPRPKLKPQDIERVIPLIRAVRVDELDMLWGSPLQVISDCLRSMLTTGVSLLAARLLACDFANVEGRVLAVLAGQEDKVELFRQNGPVYERMGAHIFGTTTEAVVLKGKDCPERDLGKRAELGCFGENTLVITHNGIKRIVDVLAADLLWDGEEWVSHSGVIYQGMKSTIHLLGVNLTPDHLVLCGTHWSTAQDLALDESILSRALETASENSPSPGIEPANIPGSAASSSVVHAAHQSTASARVTSWGDGLHGARRAQRRRQTSAEKGIGGTPTSLLTTSTENVCSTESLLAYNAAEIARTVNTGDMADEGFACLRGGYTIDVNSSHISSHFQDGISPRLKSIESTLMADTFRAICDSSQRQKTPRTSAVSAVFKSEFTPLSQKIPTYDIALAGPRNRYSILCSEGPLIVHNCGYGIGWRKFKGTAKKEANLKIPNELAQKAVNTWRKLNDKIAQYWKDLEDGAIEAVRNPGKTVVAGATKMIKFRVAGSFLWMQLPSGRNLCYPYPKMRMRVWATFVDRKDEDALKAFFGATRVEIEEKIRKHCEDYGVRCTEVKDAGMTLVYKGVDDKKRWTEQSVYGGLLAENATQATARDLLAEAMLRVEAAGYPIVLHVHDEICCEIPGDFGDLKEFEHLMCVPPEWAQGWPIAAEGWIGPRFRK